VRDEKNKKEAEERKKATKNLLKPIGRPSLKITTEEGEGEVD
jgi:hypothetical protein